MTIVTKTGPKKTAVVSGGELMGAILAKGMNMLWKTNGTPKIASARNVWTKPHQGAREIARRKARMDRRTGG